MKAYIEIRGTNSYYDLDLLMYRSYIPNINENVERTPVYGRNGLLTEKKRTYPDRVLSFGFDLKRKGNESLEDFSDRLFDIVCFFSDCSGKELVHFSNTKYKYIIKSIDINVKEDTQCHEIELEITCEPFRYKTNENTIELTKSETIYYRGTYDGECNIKIYGSGNIQLTINDETVQINNVNEYVELDSKFLLCLNKDGTSKYRDMVGGIFHTLAKGINKVSWVGSVTKVTIQPRTAYR